MSAFRLNLPALIGVFQKGYDEEEHTFEVLNEMVRQLRADPRGKDLPEDPSEALDVLLRCAAVLDAAGDDAFGVVMSADAQVPLWDAINAYAAACGGNMQTTNVRRQNAVVLVNRVLCDVVTPLVARLRGNVDALESSLAEARAERDEARRVEEIAKAEARIALRQRAEQRTPMTAESLAAWLYEQDAGDGEWLKAGEAVRRDNIRRADAILSTVSACGKSPPPERAVYITGDHNALALALAFLDEVLVYADLPRVNRKALPSLGTAGWATAWLGQVTLARLAAARVQPIETQRRIHVAATELERVLFALFDRAVPMADEAPPSPKGGRRAAT